MAPSRKSRQEKARAQPKTQIAWTLPADLLLEIVARFDLRTFVRCAATCKLLRRDILSTHFINRVSQVAPCILAYLCADAKKPIALVHPTTPAALSFCHSHLSRFLSRKAARTLLGKYEPLSSHHGLVLLRHVITKNRSKSDDHLCVYDPMSGAHTFFSNPPEIGSNQHRHHKYVLLTTADGIDYSFMLLVLDIYGWGIKVHIASSSCGTWELVKCERKEDSESWSLNKRGKPAILHGGVIHWLAGPLYKNIRRYDCGTGKTGSVEPPPTKCEVYDGNNHYLATSSDRKLLKLLDIQRFRMFVWLQLPVSAADGSGWSLETVIDMEEKMRSLDPTITGGPNERIEFEGSGKRTGDVVLLEVVRKRDYIDYRDPPIVFDLETKKMHRQKQEFSLLEIDLPSRLQTMKIFS